MEQAFFARWWREASDADRSAMKALVKSGQIEFVRALAAAMQLPFFHRRQTAFHEKTQKNNNNAHGWEECPRDAARPSSHL